MGAAGASKDKTYVDDVFSATLYEANGSSSARTITNGIDLAGEGGLVWTKGRNLSDRHALVDNERGLRYQLASNEQSTQRDRQWFNSFNSNGYTFSANDTELNYSDKDYVSWTFRKAPGFFDVVTYSGTGSARTVAHNLGSVPGMILIKCSSNDSDWSVYHRSMGATKNMHLNNNSAADTQTGVFNDTAPTSTHFTVNYDGDVNGSGKSYVAYIFAHDDAQYGTDGDESIIKCGTYNGNNGTHNIDVGFEPQFFMVKNSTSAADWAMLDIMRGAADNDTNQGFLYASDGAAEGYPLRAYATPNGIGYRTESSNTINASGQTYIYMAIRRPNKPPEAGTDVFHAYYGTPGSNHIITTGFPLDMQIAKEATSTSAHRLFTRNLGLNTWKTTSNYTKSLQPAGTDEAQIGNLTKSVYNTSFSTAGAYAGNLMIFQSFKRAPGFMDIVNYTGNNSVVSINHNLGVVPEMMWVKRWGAAGNRWQIYFAPQGNTKYSPGFFTDPFYNTSVRWGNTTPTSTQFTIGADADLNTSGGKYVNFLFASLPGISKVGTYSGTGGAINVDCGFTAGARFVMIKRTDTETQGDTPGRTDWYVWDYAMGIVSGNDPYYQLSRNWAHTTNTDYIDPLNAGFTVNTSGGGINVSGGTYVFFAVA